MRQTRGGGGLEITTEIKATFALQRTYLFRRFSFDKLLVDFLGFGRHSERRLDLLVVLAGEPKLDVLVAVFGFQKVAKCRQSV